MHRDQVLLEITELLANHGFETSNIYDRSCFDMVARRELILLLLKVLINVDGFSRFDVAPGKRCCARFLRSAGRPAKELAGDRGFGSLQETRCSAHSSERRLRAHAFGRGGERSGR